MSNLNVTTELPHASAPPLSAIADSAPKITVRDLNFFYGDARALTVTAIVDTVYGETTIEGVI